MVRRKQRESDYEMKIAGTVLQYSTVIFLCVFLIVKQTCEYYLYSLLFH